MIRFKICATAFPDLPVAEQAILSTIGQTAELKIVPLPFKSLARTNAFPDWFDDLIEADALLVRSGIIDSWLIERLKKCKVIALHGVGVDQVDVAACRSKGIRVVNVPGGNAQAVAELTIGLVLDALRGISKADAWMRCGKWDEGRLLGHELSSQKVGIVGFGHIGKKVALLARAFGARVAYFDLNQHLGDVLQVEYKPFRELLRWASVITLHVPLTKHTQGLIGKEEFTLIGKEGILINVARGPIVNQDALYHALQAHEIAWACCDVFDYDPPNFKHPLFKLTNATWTPHIGGSTYECLDTIATMASKDIMRVLNGKEPNHGV